MTAAEQLRECADAVAEACARLLEGTPAAFDCCTGMLEDAARKLAPLGPVMHDGAEALAEGWRLRRQLRVAGALVENAAAYHGGWSDRLAVQTAGYIPGGAPGAISRPPGRLWVEG